MTDQPTELDLEHRRGEHDARPAFGCRLCIEHRDCWICRCGDIRLPHPTYCPRCWAKKPKR